MITELTLTDLLLVAVTAFFAQIIGGLAGYGTGLLMPLVLVPLIGAKAVVPVISLASILSNLTRAIAFREALDWRKTVIVTLAALPFAALAAWGFTRLEAKGAEFLIAGILLTMVPLRRLLAHFQWRLSDRGLAASGAGFGLVMGGTSGSGVLLLSILMAAGLSGSQVVATDAAITLGLTVLKTGIFVGAGALPSQLWLLALLIGLMATPGTLTAKWLLRRFSARLHDVLLEAVIVVGGLVLLARALVG
jgi:uncharacterized membrane protein YfcA